SHINKALQQLPNCPITNAYGPTENAVVACCHVVDQPLPIEVSVPIGHPISNTQVYILDAQLHPVPIGVQGELCVAGDGIAAGYLNRPTLTREKFVANPFAQTALGNDLLYKTGDAVRYKPDGNIEFLGRLDTQVKIRGFRIELAEITAALERHSQVEKAVVMVREDVPGDKRLTAYITVKDTPPPTASKLYRFLKRSLPTYMVPSAFLFLDELPLTANGKVDRRALPQPEATERDIDTVFVAPTTPVEVKLSQIWGDLLQLQQVGIHDDFFELGGHSLLAVHLISQIQQAFSVKLGLSTLFRFKTIAQLAGSIEESSAFTQHSRHTPLVLLQPGQAQCDPLFLIHPIGGSVFCYGELAHHLKMAGEMNCPLYGLQAQGLEVADQLPLSLEAMAAGYVEAIRKVKPVGPYRLGGWSMGGVIAFEMAQQLRAVGEETAWLSLIDSYLSPSAKVHVSEERLMSLFARDLGYPQTQLVRLNRVLESETSDRQAPKLLEALQQYDLVPATMTAAELWRLFCLFEHHWHLWQKYEPKAYWGNVALFSCHHSRNAPDWYKIVRGSLTVHELAGTHYSIMKSPDVTELAKVLSVPFS
ncbi:MAG: thioesterase domain-containing protein, partial [Cyanobacteria bacterium J06632_22]